MIALGLTALIGADGELASADPRILALHKSAGGAPGGKLAVPGIAAVVALSRRLGVTVARPALVAEGERVLDLWVRATPDEGGTRVEVSGWSVRPEHGSEPRGDKVREEDFLRAAADWRWEVDAGLRITALSPAAAAALPGPPADQLGRPFTALFSLREDRDGGFPLLDAVAAQRRFGDQLATVRGGSGALYRLSGVPLIDARGRLAGFRGAAARAGQDAGSAQAFGPGLDAALRAPLQRIVDSAEALAADDAQPGAPYASYGADIAGAARHLLTLVDDIVDLQTIEGPGFRPEAESVDLADVARRAAGLLAVRAGEKGVQIDAPAADEALVARGDFRRILQILVNLVGNAVRYSPEGAPVWVRAERNGVARLVVADQGKGIAEGDQARIFERFERVDPSEPGGTGLGLTISRRLARAMGGDVTVDSAPGQGARFTLTLPLA